MRKGLAQQLPMRDYKNFKKLLWIAVAVQDISAHVVNCHKSRVHQDPSSAAGTAVQKGCALIETGTICYLPQLTGPLEVPWRAHSLLSCPAIQKRKWTGSPSHRSGTARRSRQRCAFASAPPPQRLARSPLHLLARPFASAAESFMIEHIYIYAHVGDIIPNVICTAVVALGGACCIFIIS